MKSFCRILTTVLLISAGKIFAAPYVVDYYGVVSQSSDANILKMAQDVFFTQLKSIDKLTVDDKRPNTAKTLTSMPLIANSEHISFYAEITENAVGTASVEWKCTFNAVGTDGKHYSKTEIYDSYYKILVGAKTAIEDVLDKIPQDEEALPDTVLAGTMSAEALAGTWSGEPYTDKIILLRGGRGFVIFKNGASMNIAVKVLSTDASGNISQLKITQVGKPNASFFPTLSRETALASAANANPIVWDFKVTANGTLSGTKTTLVPSEESPTGAAEGTENTVWIKR